VRHAVPERPKWRRFTTLDLGVVVLSYALAGGIVRAEARSSEIFLKFSDVALAGIVVLGTLALGPIIVIAHKYKGRDLALGAGEWLWIVHAGFWFMLLLFSGMGAFNGAEQSWIGKLFTYGTLIVLALSPFIACAGLVSWFIARRARAAHPWTDVAGAIMCGGASVVVLTVWLLYKLR
jgi:hypothetical protein